MVGVEDSQIVHFQLDCVLSDSVTPGDTVGCVLVNSYDLGEEATWGEDGFLVLQKVGASGYYRRIAFAWNRCRIEKDSGRVTDDIFEKAELREYIIV